MNGWPGTFWLTLQDRKDKDYALFGEAEYDVTPQITLIAGGRYYKFDNTLIGFAGFGRNPAFSGQRRLRAAAERRWRQLRACAAASPSMALQSIDDDGLALAPAAFRERPCTNVGEVVNGKARAQARARAPASSIA